MKLSKLKQIIKKTLEEQRMMKGMSGGMGMSRSQEGGGGFKCVCANGTTCPGKWLDASGSWDCSCCTKCPEIGMTKGMKEQFPGKYEDCTIACLGDLYNIWCTGKNGCFNGNPLGFPSWICECCNQCEANTGSGSSGMTNPGKYPKRR